MHRERRQAAVWQARVQRHQPGLHRIIKAKAGIGQQHRTGDMVQQIIPQRAPAHPLHGLPGPIGGDAVNPARARIGQQRQLDAGLAARRGGIECAPLSQLGRHEFIAQPAGVGEQLPERDRAGRRAGDGLAGIVKAFQHLGARQFGQHRANISVQRQLALLHQLQRRHRCERFGHGGDLEQIIHRQRRAARPLGAYGDFADRAARAAHGGHRAGDAGGGKAGLQCLDDAVLHAGLPRFAPA